MESTEMSQEGSNARRMWLWTTRLDWDTTGRHLRGWLSVAPTCSPPLCRAEGSQLSQGGPGDLSDVGPGSTILVGTDSAALIPVGSRNRPGSRRTRNSRISQ